ncbi:nickel insertion protein [Halanaerobacter jeridensis]|uniref:Uncharacterized protein (DUF111 family) n=1 Tax=Halanaerobacter jeridensis TaxID=706427 RepID=A0A939BPY1_9FIRM|nr:nickel insertion protein [Halanaerobacter jeridensis]MBM7557632.1 uncharacterized protein (DUF111 family) [Halanaerobacter jeridensis]
MMLETNIDDMNPEFYSHLYPKLFEQGALDVYLTNIMMKKNRPAVKISILAKAEDVEEIANTLFKETTTLGIRKYEVEKECLERDFYEVETKWSPVTVKVAKKEGKVINYAPEYDDCQSIAEKFDVPLKEVYQVVKDNFEI